MRVTLADGARSTELLPLQVAAPEPKVDAVGTSDSGFGHVLQGIGRELAHGEATTRSAIASMTSGAQTDPAQLIALQMGVYRYSEAIDLASRLVDRVTGGVKTVLQGTGQ
jgi:hypothetical protein